MRTFKTLIEHIFKVFSVAVGLFADNPIPLETTSGRTGLFKGGGWYLFGIQCLAAFCLLCWVRIFFSR